MSKHDLVPPFTAAIVTIEAYTPGIGRAFARKRADSHVLSKVLLDFPEVICAHPMKGPENLLCLIKAASPEDLIHVINSKLYDPMHDQRHFISHPAECIITSARGFELTRHNFYTDKAVAQVWSWIDLTNPYAGDSIFDLMSHYKEIKFMANLIGNRKAIMYLEIPYKSTPKDTDNAYSNLIDSIGAFHLIGDTSCADVLMQR